MTLPVGILQMIRDAVAMLDDADAQASAVRPKMPLYKEIHGRTRHVDPKNRLALNRLYVAYQLAQALRGQGNRQDADVILGMIPAAMAAWFERSDLTAETIPSAGEGGDKAKVGAILPG